MKSLAVELGLFLLGACLFAFRALAFFGGGRLVVDLAGNQHAVFTLAFQFAGNGHGHLVAGADLAVERLGDVVVLQQENTGDLLAVFALAPSGSSPSILPSGPTGILGEDLGVGLMLIHEQL